MACHGRSMVAGKIEEAAMVCNLEVDVITYLIYRMLSSLEADMLTELKAAAMLFNLKID